MTMRGSEGGRSRVIVKEVVKIRLLELGEVG